MDRNTLHQQLLQAVKTSGTPEVSRSETSIESISRIPRSMALKALELPVGENLFKDGPSFLHRVSQSDRVEGVAQTVPCFPTSMSLELVNFKSDRHDSVGQDTLATNIRIIGYDIATDSAGRPQMQTIKNPSYKKGSEAPEELTVPVLIDKDENGNPIEPKTLMTFKYLRALDKNGGISVQIMPVSNVPKVQKKVKSATGQEYTTEGGIDWKVIHSNFEPVLMSPVLNHNDFTGTDKEFMDLFVELIPYSGPAQERLKAKAEGTQGGGAYTPPPANVPKNLPSGENLTQNKPNILED